MTPVPFSREPVCSRDSKLMLVMPPPTVTAGIHPMLAPQAPVRDRSNRGGNHFTPLSQSVPPDLLRSMEQLFGMQNMLSDLMNQLGDGTQTTIQFEVRSNLPSSTAFRHRLFAPMSSSRSRHQGSNNDTHPFKLANEFIGMETTTRWQQATSMWLGSSTIGAERAAIYETPIFKRLEPLGLEEERVRKAKEEEERKAQEEKRKQQAEEERRKAQEEAEKAEAERRERDEAERLQREEEAAREQEARERLAAEALIESSNAPGTIAMEGVETENAPEEAGESADNEATGEAAGQPEVAPVERAYTTLRGSRVDITGLGVDPEFLDALPEDMREEVLYQHIRERRAAAPPDQPSTLDPSFLEALPDEIRAELLEEEADERRRQERLAQRRTAGAAPPAGDMDNANFLASLDPPLRQAILLEQDEEFIAQLPPHIAAEANALRERVGHRLPFISRHAPPNLFTELRRKQPSPKRKDGIQMLEKWGLATLIRLTFLRNRPESLQDILIALAPGRRKRGCRGRRKKFLPTLAQSQRSRLGSVARQSKDKDGFKLYLSNLGRELSLSHRTTLSRNFESSRQEQYVPFVLLFD